MRHTGLHNQGLWWMTLTAPGGATSNIHCATSVAHVRLGFSRASGITGGRSLWLTLLCSSSSWSCTSLVVPHSETQKGSTTMSPSERTGWVKQDLAGSSSRQVCRLELLLYNINIMAAWRFVNESLCSYLQQLMIGFKLPKEEKRLHQIPVGLICLYVTVLFVSVIFYVQHNQTEDSGWSHFS